MADERVGHGRNQAQERHVGDVELGGDALTGGAVANTEPVLDDSIRVRVLARELDDLSALLSKVRALARSADDLSTLLDRARHFGEGGHRSRHAS